MVIKLWYLDNEFASSYVVVDADNILPYYETVKKSPKGLPYI